RFQIKYGSKQVVETDSGIAPRRHSLWQDPYGLYTTMLVGINPEKQFFVSADPVLHSPTKFFVSLEFKEADARQILDRGWHAWERERASDEERVEVLAGGTRDNFLRCVRLEREAIGEDQGHRMLLAEQMGSHAPVSLDSAAVSDAVPIPTANHLHSLALEF